MKISLSQVKALRGVFRGKDTKKIIELNDSIYSRAKSAVDSIPQERIDEAVKILFKPQGEGNSYLSDIETLRGALTQGNAPQEVIRSLDKIETRALAHIKSSSKDFAAGKAVKPFETGDIDEDFNAIRKYFFDKRFNSDLPFDEAGNKLREQYDVLMDRISQMHYRNNPFDSRIGRLKEGVLPADGRLYHGTTHAKAIEREGFSATKSNQLERASREFGAGVYLTPDRVVASNFAGVTGRIVPVEATVQNTAEVNVANFDKLSNEIFQIMHDEHIYPTGTRFDNAYIELLNNRLFRTAGYDSVYTSNSMASGLFAKSADSWLGRPQSQLVVFDASKVKSIGSKPTSQKIKDEFLQLTTRGKVLYNLTKMSVKDPVGAMMM